MDAQGGLFYPADYTTLPGMRAGAALHLGRGAVAAQKVLHAEMPLGGCQPAPTATTGCAITKGLAALDALDLDCRASPAAPSGVSCSLSLGQAASWCVPLPADRCGGGASFMCATPGGGVAVFS